MFQDEGVPAFQLMRTAGILKARTNLLETQGGFRLQLNIFMKVPCRVPELFPEFVGNRFLYGYRCQRNRIALNEFMGNE